MSWQNVVALAVFVGVCGFIAYAGDLLGRRMGKRRLSLFGMRPRFTAIVTTTITGMLIAILSVTLMSIASSQVRELVLRGAELAMRYEQARASYTLAEKQLKRQKRITETAKAEADKALQRQKSLEKEMKKVTADLKKLKADLALRQAALQRTTAQLSRAQTNLASAAREITERKEQIAKLEERWKQLDDQIKGWEISYAGLREGKIIFHPHQEIARREISCSMSKPMIRGEIIELLRDASRKAREEGAKLGDNGRAVRIRPVKFEGDDRLHEESEIIDAVVSAISSGSGKVVSRLYSWKNSFEGEQVLVDCESNPDWLVYSKGDEVASTVMDGASSRGDILGKVILFLQKEVNPSAIRKGIIPIYEENDQASVGQIDNWNRIFDLVDRIKATGKRVSVRAVAADDTWSAGPLVLDWVVGDST